MKGKKLLGIISLGLFAAVSVGAAFTLNTAKEIKADYASGESIYVRLTDPDYFWGSGATMFANYQDSNDNWHTEQIAKADKITTKSEGDANVYKYELTASAKNFQILRRASDGTTGWDATSVIDVGENNIFEVGGKDYDSHLYATWASASITNVSLVQPAHGTISVKDHNSEISGEGYYYSDWTLDFTCVPASGYEFVNWTTGSGDDWTGEDKSDNPVTITGLKGDFSVSAKLEESYDPTTVKYYAKVGPSAYSLMTYVSSFPYAETKTGYKFKLENVSGYAGHKVQFKQEDTVIYPGASSPREEKDNNLLYDGSSKEIKLLTDATNETLELYVYDDGFDSFLTGYVAHNATYYFTSNKGWEGTPKIYLLDQNTNPKQESWPGNEEMTFVDYDGDNNSRYTFTVDTNRWPKFIITNQDGSDQTVNCSFASYNENGFYLNERDELEPTKWTVSKYPYAEIVRKISLGETQYDLQQSTGVLDEGVLVQFETKVNIELEAGSQISYLADGKSKGYDLQGYGRNNAYYDSTAECNKVLANATGKIYVKILSDRSTKVMVMGIDQVSAGYHVFLNDNKVIELVDSGETPEGYTGQTCSESITFHTGDKFRLIDTSSSTSLPVPFKVTNFDTYSDKNFVKDGDYVKYVGEAASYDASIYLKLKPGEDMVYVGKADPAVAAAKEYAIAFNTAIGNVCKWDSSTDRTELETAWATQAANYKALTAEVKTEVKKGAESHVLEIQQFAAKYNLVITRHKIGSGWNLEDFLNNVGSNDLVRTQTTDSIDNGALIAVVSVIAVTSISAIAVLLVIKRRKSI